MARKLAVFSRAKLGWPLRLLLIASFLFVGQLAFPHQALAAVIASDSFNRADGGLGPNWTATSDGAMAIASQQVTGIAGQNTGEIRTAESYPSDQFSQVLVSPTALTGGQWIGPAVRMQASGQSLYTGIYFWNSGSPELMLFLRKGGNWKQLGSTVSSGALPAGTQLQVTVVGSTISFLENGVAKITVTDTNLTGGAPGIMAYGNPDADTWSGGSAGSGTYSVGGSVSGLSGTVVLQDNGGDTLSVSANGSFTFGTQLAGGAAYAVTVKTNPSGQTCTVASGSGAIASANVTNVAVTCTANSGGGGTTYSVGGSVSGLSGTVVLQDNGGDTLSVSANGSFTFATQLPSGAAYNVTVQASPSGQTCTVAGGSGAIASANVTNVAVTCTTSGGGGVPGETVIASDSFNRADGSLGPNWTATSDGAMAIASQQVVGTAGQNTGEIRTAETYPSDQFSQVLVSPTQLTGGQWIGPMVRMQANGQSGYLGIYFWNSGSPELMLFLRKGGNWLQLGTYNSGALPAGTQLQVTAVGSTISFLENGVAKITVTDTNLTGGAPGIMAYGNPDADTWSGGSVGSGSSTTYSVGGSVSGLSGTVVLQDNGTDTLSVTANGSFTFATQLPSGAAYAVTVKTNPSGQTCTVAGGSGAIASANVTNVAVTCTANAATYSVGGSVSGLSGTVVLQDNGTDTLSVTANGSFTFATQLPSGAAYAVTVKTNPSGQTCTVAGGSGAIASANVTNVAVTCTANAATYSVGGSVSGLSGTVVLQDNGGDTLSVTANGSFTFATQLPSGAAYNVTVQASPSGQTCTVAGGSGAIASANVTNVAVTCTTSGGGGVPGETVIASDSFNRADGSLGPNWTATSDGAMAIASQQVVGTAGQNTGEIRTAETYPSDQFSQVLVSPTQLTGGQWIGPMVRMQANGQSGYLGIYFWNSGSPELMLFLRKGGNWLQLGTYNSGALPAGTQLQVSAVGSTISFLENGVAKITVTDTNLTGGAPGIMAYGNPDADTWSGGSAGSGTYSVGGSVSGLSGTVVLQDNGTDTLSVTANGSFTFATQLPSGAAYAVTVKTNPSGQTCTVAGGSGAIASANVTNVAVTCTANSGGGGTTYSVGGSVSGLSGTVVLQDNGTDTLSVTANGSFTFATQLPSGAAYAVTVQANPSGQTCTVAGGSGAIASANVTNVAVTCAAVTQGSASDDFNRADGGLGPNWTATSDGAMAIASQQVVGTAGQNTGEIRTAESYPSDQFSQVLVTSTQLTGGQWIGPAVRMQASGQSAYTGIYNWNSGTPELMLFLRNAGNWTELGAADTPALSAGTSLRLIAVGNTISFQVNGVQQIGASDDTLTGGAPGMLANADGTMDNWSGGSAGFQVSYASMDSTGIKSYDVISANNGDGPQTLRVLTPTNPAAGVAHNFLIVLPVEAGLGSDFGDGLATLQSLNAQNQYNLTIIEPTFAIDSWDANNPNDPRLQYETFLTQELVPWIKQNLATTGNEQTWLIGFSKSGLGVQDLILKHPDLFTLAASWDFPADMSTYDGLGSDPAANYGTDANYQANYRLTTSFVDNYKGPFLSNNRIWIGGYSLYQTDVSDYDAILTSEGIAHSTETPQYMAHRWDSGWMPIALAALYHDSINQH